MSDYPEHDKLSAVKDKSQVIGEFIEWLNGEGIVFARWSEPLEQLVHDYELGNIQRVLAKYFEIDLTKIDVEKRAMLELMRAANDQG